VEYHRRLQNLLLHIHNHPLCDCLLRRAKKTLRKSDYKAFNLHRSHHHQDVQKMAHECTRPIFLVDLSSKLY